MEGKKLYDTVSVEVIELKLTSAIVGSPGEGGGGGGQPDNPNEDDNEP